ncbi:DUF3108 domain-containing protein [Ideonella azotifigens]|uniref:DUF3108 domain-containing protein n=1 Tax=Ideonella azotifigens TaxID=513160 RepID=UPI001E64D432|nr:DUF3108 domain-containing protein [Ideonella azotifigens]MCD2338867.1 DUF3108 domain-containing protein [Ideonella azotifigens]
MTTQNALPPSPAAARHRGVLLGIVAAVLLAHGLLLPAPNWRDWRWTPPVVPTKRSASVTLAAVRLPPPIAAAPSAQPATKPKPPPQTAARPPAVASTAASAALETSPDNIAQEGAEPGLPDIGGLMPELPTLTLPQPLQLRYSAQRNDGQPGQAELLWQPDAQGEHYTLHWQVSLPGGRGEQDWQSSGELGDQGLLPVRMVERKRGKDQHAVNFQREKQLISFSGPSGMQRLMPGTQDRASWLLQLPMIVQALAGSDGLGVGVGTLVTLPVATVRGDLDFWQFEVQAGPPLQLPNQAHPLPAWRLVREPQRPYDQRIEVWLARERDMLPAQLRFTTVPGENSLTLTLLDGLPPPAETSASAPPPGHSTSP